MLLCPGRRATIPKLAIIAQHICHRCCTACCSAQRKMLASAITHQPSPGWCSVAPLSAPTITPYVFPLLFVLLFCSGYVYGLLGVLGCNGHHRQALMRCLTQVKNREGQWINADPIPGTFVCNIGDMLKVKFAICLSCQSVLSTFVCNIGEMFKVKFAVCLSCQSVPSTFVCNIGDMLKVEFAICPVSGIPYRICHKTFCGHKPIRHSFCAWSFVLPAEVIP